MLYHAIGTYTYAQYTCSLWLGQLLWQDWARLISGEGQTRQNTAFCCTRGEVYMCIYPTCTYRSEYDSTLHVEMGWQSEWLQTSGL